MTQGGLTQGNSRDGLLADCSHCQALCCVGPVLTRSADFAIDKPAAVPCRNLLGDSCGIHTELRPRGFPGCLAFDCFGAGQQVVQVTFAGRHRNDGPDTAAAMFAALPVVQQLHETLWHLAQAAEVLPPGALHSEVVQLSTETRALASGSADELARLDTAAHRGRVGPLLALVSETVRSAIADRGPDQIGADLIGARLAGADLHGVSLRGAYLIGADLSGADLRCSDLLGADLRGADLRGARLTDALFLTRSQVAAAQGDITTTLPAVLESPPHWRPTRSSGAPADRRAGPVADGAARP